MMALELLLLCALIFIFIVSFCGLLQKIKQSYERERLIADRIARRRTIDGVRQNSGESFSEVYVNSAYVADGRTSDGGVFPAAPPPYTQNVVDPPPKYEDVIKSNAIEVPESVTITVPESQIRPTSQPPPYTIST